MTTPVRPVTTLAHQIAARMGIKPGGGATAAPPPPLKPDQDYTLASTQPAPPPVEEWDYKTTATGPKGEPLPQNALGWRPDGTPDFGQGITAFKNKRLYMLENAWKKGWNAGDDVNQRMGYTDDLMPRMMSAWETTKTIGGTIAEPLFFALGIPAMLTKQLAGSVGAALQDMIYLDKKLNEIDWKGNWEASRLAYSNAMRPLMGADGNLRGEFIRRMNNGERPDLIAEDMLMNGQANVWIELIGEIGFDPLNAFGKMEKINKTRRGIKMAQLDTKVLESTKAAEILGDTMKTSDNLAGFRKLQDAFGEIRKTYEEARASTQLLSKPGVAKGKVIERMKDMLQLTPSSRAESQIARQGTMWKAWYKALDGNESKMLDLMRDFVRWDKGDEAAQLAALKNLFDSGIPLESLFSRAGNDTIYMTVRMFEDHGTGLRKVFGKLPGMEDLLRRKELKLAGALGLGAKGERLYTKRLSLYALKMNDIKASLAELKAGRDADMFSEIYSKVDQNIETLRNKLAELEKKAGGLDEARLVRLAKTDSTVAKLFSQIDEAMKTPLYSVGDQAHYLLKTLARTIDDAFPSAKSMLEAERKVAEGVKGEKLERLAAMAKELRPYERWIGKLHNMAQDKAVGQLNRMFAKVYLGLSPGYAFRNMSQNTFQMWLDYGTSVFFGEVGDSAMMSATKRNGGLAVFAGEKFGHTPFGEVEDIERTGVAGFWPLVKKTVAGKLDMRIPAENAEAWASRTIVGKTYNRVFDQSMETVVKAAMKDARFKDLTPEMGRLLEKELRDNYGDAGLAIKAVKRTVKNGIQRLFEDSNNVPPKLREYLKQLDSVNAWERFTKEVLTAKTPDEALAAVEKILGESEIKASMGVIKDVTPDLDDPLQAMVALGIEGGALPSTVMRGKQALIYGTDQTVKAISEMTTRLSQKLSNVPAWEQNAILDPIKGWTNNLEKVREKVKLAAENIIPRGHKNPAEAWKELVKHFGITDNIPVPLTGDEFRRLAWRQVNLYSNKLYSRDVFGILEKLENYIPAMFAKYGEGKNPQAYLDEAAKIRKYFEDTQSFVFAEGGAAVVELPIEGPRLGAITTLAKRYGMQTMTPGGKPLDQYLLNVINKYSGLDFTDLNDDISLEMVNRAFAKEAGKAGQEYKIAEVIPAGRKKVVELAKKFGIPENEILQVVNEDIGSISVTAKTDVIGNARKLIADAGGININEFSDVMGGKVGVDTAGVRPGLFTKKGMGIDYAGRLLAENNFITPEQAEDANFVRDFIRKFQNESAEFKESFRYEKIEEIPAYVAENAFMVEAGAAKPQPVGTGALLAEAVAKTGEEVAQITIKHTTDVFGTSAKFHLPEGTHYFKHEIKGKRVILTPVDINGNPITINLESGSTIGNGNTINVSKEIFERDFTIGTKVKEAVAKTGEAVTEAAPEVAKSFLPENVHFIPSSPNSLPSKEESIIRNNPFVRQDIADYIRSNFDEVKEITSGIGDEVWDLLRKDLTGKVVEARTVATQVAQAHRDFTLINYGRETYRGVLASYFFPYYKWYAGTYGNYARRIMRDPTILSHYQMLKDALATTHSNLPEWYKYNINTDDLLPDAAQKWLGLDGSPLFMNIEQTIWPLQGLTGVDFNDPKKVTGWWTYVLDQLGKFGPSIWTPMTLVTGLALKAGGQEDAGERWISRFSSLTATAKSIGAAFGKNVELDPFVLAFEGGAGGATPSEDDRVRRALAEMMQKDQGNLELQAQFIDAAHSRSGPLWEQAKILSDKNRLLGNVMSTFGGAGLKARTKEDIEIDRFYSEYSRLMSLRPNISPENFRNQMALLGQKYPFMDTVLIGNKADEKRDAAFAYNVLSRIPPGDMSRLLELVGVYPDTLDAFYESKGDLSAMEEDDRMRFNAAMLSLAAISQVPDAATRQEWNLAKSQYNEMEEKAGIAAFDEKGNRTPTRIGDMLQTYYSYLEEDGGQAKIYLDSHPELQQAFDLRNAYIANNSTLNAYYGGMETIEKYYQSLERAKLKERFGDNIYALYDYYNTRLFDAKSKKIFEKQHPELVAFRAAKNAYQDSINRQVGSLAAMMPEGKPPGLREPQTETQALLQENVLAAQRGVTPEQLWSDIQKNPQLAELVKLHIQGMGDLSYDARRRLEYIGGYHGLTTADEVLQILFAGLAP